MKDNKITQYVRENIDVVMKVALSIFLLAISFWLLFDRKEIHIYHHTDNISADITHSANINHCEDCSHNENKSLDERLIERLRKGRKR